MSQMCQSTNHSHTSARLFALGSIVLSTLAAWVGVIALLSSSASQASAQVACEPSQPLPIVDKHYVGNPSVSSDGRRVAFWATGDWTGRNSDGNLEVFLLELEPDGSPITLTQITDSRGNVLGGFNLAPSLSADGRYVAFFSDRNLSTTLTTTHNADGNFEIFLAYVSPTHTVQLTQVTHTRDRANTYPSVSSDGTRIAFISDAELDASKSNADANGELVLAELHGGSITFTQITSTPVSIVNDRPALSADGRFVAFLSQADLVAGSNPDGNLEVFLADLALAHSPMFTQVTSSTGATANEAPFVSGDGRYIVFASNGNYTGQNSDGSFEVFLYDRNANTLIQRTAQAGTDSRQPQISGEGSLIAFTTQNGQQLLVSAPSVGITRTAASGQGSKRSPFLSADGTRIAYLDNARLVVSTCPLADVSVTSTVTPQTVTWSSSNFGTGIPVTYTAIISNRGPSPAADVSLNVALQGIRPFTIYDYNDVGTKLTVSRTAAIFVGSTTSPTVGMRILSSGAPTLSLPANRSTTDWIDMRDNILLLKFDSSLTTESSGAGASVTAMGATGVYFTNDWLNGKASFIDIPYYYFNSGLRVEPASLFQFSPLSQPDFTLMAWVRAWDPDSNMGSVGNGIYPVFSTRRSETWFSSDSEQFQFGISFPSATSDHFPVLQIRNRYGYFNITFEQRIQAPVSVKGGQWRHIAAVVRLGARRVQLYVDGQLAASEPLNWWYSVTPNEPLYIGTAMQGSYRVGGFSGSMDEVAIFKRALSDAEINLIYNVQRPKGQPSLPQRASAYGILQSREMDGGSASAVWQGMEWETYYPAGIPLPRGGTLESGFAQGNADMRSATVLLHLDEIGTLNTPLANDVDPTLNPDGFAHCTLGNDVRCPRIAAGRYGAGRAFRGNSGLYVDDSPGSNPVSYTVETWLNIAALDPNETAYLVSRSSSGAFEPFNHIQMLCLQRGSGEGISVCHSTLDQNSNTHLVTATLGDGTLAGVLGRWFHLAGTYEYSGTDTLLRLYVNGQIAGEKVITGQVAPLSGLNRVYVGMRSPMLSQPGKSNYALDEVAVHRRALSAAEIYAHYLRGTAWLRFQTRACGSSCSGADWRGPNGLFSLYPRDNIAQRSYVLSMPPAQKAQYRAFLFADTDILTSTVTVQPLLNRVQLQPEVRDYAITDGVCVGQSLIACTIPLLNPNQSVTLTARMVLSTSARGAITHTAVAQGVQIDPTASNNFSAASNFAVMNVNLSVTQSASSAAVFAGEIVSYFIRVSNLGPLGFSAREVVVTHSLPLSGTFLACLASLPVSCAMGHPSVISFTNDIPSGSHAYITLTLRVTASMPTGTYPATVHVSSPDPDPNLSDNTATLSTTINQRADLILAAKPISALLGVGDRLTHTLTITNLGPSWATNARLTYTLPSLATDPAWDAPGMSCNQVGSQVVCLAGAPLFPNEVISAQIGSGITPTSTLTYTAQVSADQADPNLTNNNATLIRLTAQAPLSGSITPSTAISGSATTFTVVIGPPYTTLPLTYTWQAESGTPAPSCNASNVMALSRTCNIQWNITGTFNITATVSNVFGSVDVPQTVTVTTP